MTATIEHPPRQAPAAGELVDTPRHPLARRLADVLRPRAEQPRTVVVDDVEPIDRAVRAGVRLDSLYVVEPLSPDDVALPPGTDEVPVHVLARAVAEDLFGTQKAARVLALARAPRPWRLADVTTRAGDVLVLDGVRIVGNIGAITRTAAALGAAGVVVLDSGLRTVLDRRLVRASRGLVFTTPVVLSTRAALLAHLCEAGVPLAVLDAQDGAPLAQLGRVPGRLALALGGERDGVTAALAATASHRYAIGMTGGVDSLNVSVAAALALWEHRARG